MAAIGIFPILAKSDSSFSSRSCERYRFLCFSLSSCSFFSFWSCFRCLRWVYHLLIFKVSRLQSTMTTAAKLMNTTMHMRPMKTHPITERPSRSMTMLVYVVRMSIVSKTENSLKMAMNLYRGSEYVPDLIMRYMRAIELMFMKWNWTKKLSVIVITIPRPARLTNWKRMMRRMCLCFFSTANSL